MLDDFRSTTITWDKATSRIYSPVTANASDENGRKLVVQIVNSGQVEDLTGATLHLYWETRDKAHNGLDVFDAVDLKKGEFELSYTTGMLSNQGVLNANLVLIDTVGRVVSERFKITVTEGIDNDAIQSENSFSSLTQALIDVSNLEQGLSSQLAQKVGGGVLAEMSDLSQTVKEGMTGGAVAVVGEGAVSEVNLANDLKKNLTLNIENLITNGLFASGYDPWTVGTTTASVSNNKLILDFPTASSQNIIYPGSRVTGHKYYGKITFEQLAGSFAGQTLFIGGVNKDFTSPLNTPNTISRIETAPSVGGSLFQFTLITPTVGAKIAISKPVFIDLTETFGAGKEPSLEEMDSIVSSIGGYLEGKQNLFNSRSILDKLTSLNITKADKDELEEIKQTVSKPGVLVDNDTGELINYELNKDGRTINIEWEETRKPVTLTDVAYDNLSYQELFVDRNVISNSHFTNDLTGHNIGAGTPTVSTTVYNTPTKSLKTFGTSSQYLLNGLGAEVRGKTLFVAAKVRVDRYVSGGVGVRVNSSTHDMTQTITRTTDGFETVSGVYRVETSDSALLIGSISANADGYVDDVMVIDVTDISSVDINKMTILYEMYLKFLKDDNTDFVVKKTRELNTSPVEEVHDVEARNAFIEKMNEKAKDIGMTNTAFYDAVGSDYGRQLTTARDMTLMGIHATSYVDLLNTWGVKTHNIRVLGNQLRTEPIETTVTSPLLDNHYFVFGGKTGTTTVKNLLVIGEGSDGKWLACAVIDAIGDRFEVAKQLFDIVGGDTTITDVSANHVAIAEVPTFNSKGYKKYPFQMLWEKAPDIKKHPASVTKVMSAMVMLDYVSDLNETITITKSDEKSGSGFPLFAGDIITYRDALFGMMLPSSNTCAQAVARCVGERIVKITR